MCKKKEKAKKGEHKHMRAFILQVLNTMERRQTNSQTVAGQTDRDL